MTRRRKIVALEDSYHGHSGLTIAAAGNDADRDRYLMDYPQEFSRVPWNDWSAMERAVDDATAGVLIEAMPGRLGLPPPQPGYLERVRKLCSDRGALLIFDEVITGVGGTGTFWLYQQESFVPALDQEGTSVTHVAAWRRFLWTVPVRGFWQDFSDDGRLAAGTLAELGLDRNTMIVFTSDNGPQIRLGLDGGSAGPLRGGKSTTYEGGFRVPFVARWPGRIPAKGSSAEPAAMMDLFPTILKLAGGGAPSDRPIDGRDMWPLLAEQSASFHKAFYYLLGPLLEAIRVGPWKLRQGPDFPRFITGLSGFVERSRAEKRAFTAGAFFEGLEVELFNVEVDPGERLNVAGEHPEIVEDLRQRMERFAADLEPGAAMLGWPVPGLSIPGLEQRRQQ